MTTCARNIMQTDLITVGVEEPLLTVYRLFVREDISGAPVVDERGTPVGVISTRDLLRTAEQEHDEAQRKVHFYAGGSLSGDEWRADVEEFEDRLSRVTAADVMNPEVIAVAPDTSVPEVADCILKHEIHRVLVIDPEQDGSPLVGIISLFDLVHLLR
jgi:CBS domain-containing protein